MKWEKNGEKEVDLGVAGGRWKGEYDHIRYKG